MIKRFDIDCVFDVGASIGLYGEFLRNEVGYRGQILSFEPVKANVKRLRQSGIGDRHWAVFDFALGDREAVKSINIMKSYLFTSFLMPDAVTVPYFGDLNHVVGEEAVMVRRLDDIFDSLRQEYSFENPFLKIDTQGYDLAVLKGCAANLNKFAAIQTEASVKPLYQAMPGFLDIYDYLTPYGFALSGFNPVVLDPNLRLIEFDWVFLNQRFCI